MRRLAQVLAGVLALGFMLMYVPWDLYNCTGGCNPLNTWDGYVFALYRILVHLVVAILLTVVLVGVLGMRDVGSASESAVLAALGQSRAAAALAAAKTGAIDAAVAVGAGFVITGGLHVWLIVRSGSPIDEGLGQWLPRVVVAVIFAFALVAAHVIDATRPRTSPVDLLHADAAEPPARRFPLRARLLVFGTIAGTALGVSAGIALSHDPHDRVAGDTARTIAQGAQITLLFAVIALSLSVGVPLALKAMRPAVLSAANVLGSLKAPRAAQILRARAGTASVSSSRTVLAVCTLALILGASAHVDPAPALSPTYVGSVEVDSPAASSALAAEYRQIEGVGNVLTAPMVLGDYPTVGVDPGQIAAVDPTLGALLASNPGAIVSPSGFTGVSIADFTAVGIQVTGIVPVSTCCRSFVDADQLPPTTTTILLIYSAPGYEPSEVAQRVWEYMPIVDEDSGWNTSTQYDVTHYSQPLWAFVANVALLGLVVGGPVIALAVGVAKRRRRDDATLAALGATRRTLRAVAVVETTVLAAIAVGIGLLCGAVVQSAMAVTARAEDSLDGVITHSYLYVALRSVDWAGLGLIFVIALGIFAAVAWLASHSVSKQLPAEQLRSVHAGGLS